jgi:hypothetical protein
MSRTAVALAAFSMLVGGAHARAQSVRGGVIPSQMARQQGLERAWVAQVEIDRARGRVAHITLHDGLLLVQTDQAALHVLDAETRRTLWVAHVGRPGAPTTAPAASDKFVASTTGPNLYLFDRHSGRVLWERHLASVPSAGPALSDVRVYVPMVNGVVATYRLPRPHAEETPLEAQFKDSALNYRGKGMADSAPVITPNGVIWGTAAGNIYSCTPDEMLALWRFKAHDAISAPLFYRPPTIFAASRDGYVYALHETRGDSRWQFSTGNPVAETPVVIGDALFAIPETGGMFRINADTGEQEWYSPGVFKFVSASPTRLYAVDSTGRLLILNARTGARLGSLATEHLPLKVFNAESDRIYLGTTAGMIQCLREPELAKPFMHGLPAPAPEDAKRAEEGADDKGEKAEMPAEDPNDPFGAAAPEKDGDDEMPADDKDAPAAEMADEDKDQ